MEQFSIHTNEPSPPYTPSPLWRIFRVIPLTLMLFTLGSLLILFFAGGLMKITAWYLFQFIPPVLGLITLIGVGLYALLKRKFHRLAVATLALAGITLIPIFMWVNPIAFPSSIGATEPSATVRLPTDVPLKVAWGGDKIETNYHVVSPDQRWAYDLFVEPYVTGSDQLEDYGCYGVPIVAPASGVVAVAHDGEPDEIPGIISNNLEAPTGNHVAIQLETGTYLIIAHMKQGSVTVQTGDTVIEGQVIGQCGNSGNTSEPHIHIHHQRQDPTVFPLNFAEGLPLYFRDHDGAPMPVGGFEMDGDTATALGDTVQHIGK